MARASAALALMATVLAGALLVSGGTAADPRTPAGLPRLPEPFLGVAAVGGGAATAAVDAYGDVVDLRRAPAGPALLAVAAARQTAGTVAPATAIVPRLRLGDGRALPFWRADAVTQRYLRGTQVLVTTARFGRLRARVAYGAGAQLACTTAVLGAVPSRGRPPHGPPRPRVVIAATGVAAGELRCQDPGATAALTADARSERRWLAGASPLAPAAPAWATRLYRRSLLVLRALTDRRTGAVAAGARDGWAYVWPRDAAAAALAFRAAGFRAEARRIGRFLLGLDLGAAARFHGDGSPVPGRAAQGDAAGWVAVAAGPRRDRAPRPGRTAAVSGIGWTDRADYQEKAAGDYLGDAIAATALDPPAKRRGACAQIERAFANPRAEAGPHAGAEPGALARAAHDPASGVDSAAAWAIRPFSLPCLYPAARASLRQLLASGGRFGIVPSADWPQRDPWTAPTAWSAWAFAALSRWDERAGRGRLAGSAPARAARPSLAAADRRAALALLGDLRRAATPLGTLPERVDAGTGTARSTTPLAWSHAFAVLALQELWPAARR